MSTNYHFLRENLEAPHIVDVIERIALPYGDEFGDGCTVDVSRSTPDRIVITLGYVHENHDTAHSELRRHEAIVTPEDIATCHVDITGPDLYDHNDTIAEVVWYGLCQSSSLAEDLARTAKPERHRALARPSRPPARPPPMC